MKNSYFILLIFLFITSCSEDDSKQLVSENATLYYYFDPGFGTSSCHYVLETESNKTFVPNTTFDLSVFWSKNESGSNTPKDVKVTYRLTVDRIEGCYHDHHKTGFLFNPTDVVEILSIEDLSVRNKR